jgi:two-component system cell cycle sensor histidine kinase/response regulator CckA
VASLIQTALSRFAGLPPTVAARDHTGSQQSLPPDALEPDEPEAPATGGEIRRGWPLQWYFALLVALFLAAAAAAGVYVHAQGGRDGQLTIIALGLVCVLLAALLVYRGIARPIEQLGAAVQSSGRHTPPVPVSASGPAEVTSLAGDINALISTVGREMEERNRAEEARRSSEGSYHHLFEDHPSPVWVFDKETLRILTVNAAAIATYGYSREEFLELTIADLRLPEDREGLGELIASRPDEFVDAGVVRHTKKDGTVMHVALSSSPTDFEGHPARLVLALDITEQRRLEEQLRQTQKMEAIGNLAGAVAHDFNNVLMVIRTCSGLLLNRLTDSGERQDVQQIDDAAKRGAELTHQMLAFSRQKVLHPQATDLNAVVEDTLVLLRRLLGEEVETVSDLDSKVESIIVDRGQLTQVIMNLAVNARDAMPGGGTLSVRTANVVLDEGYAAKHADVTPGHYALLQVTDSGTGMDEETKSRAFDPFFTSKETGTGLGLATVYGSVKQSGGHISLYSEQGMGTTFKIYFPIAGAPVEAETPPVEVTSLEGSETILLVEDEEMIRPLVAEALRSFGYTVDEADNCASALEIARELDGSIDLLLTDVVMPGMNGREVAEILLADDPGLTVLYTSGYPADSILRHGAADATVAYIEKPYLVDELGRKVRELLESRPEPGTSR